MNTVELLTVRLKTAVAQGEELEIDLRFAECLLSELEPKLKMGAAIGQAYYHDDQESAMQASI